MDEWGSRCTSPSASPLERRTPAAPLCKSATRRASLTGSASAECCAALRASSSDATPLMTDAAHARHVRSVDAAGGMLLVTRSRPRALSPAPPPASAEWAGAVGARCDCASAAARSTARSREPASSTSAGAAVYCSDAARAPSARGAAAAFCAAARTAQKSAAASLAVATEPGPAIEISGSELPASRASLATTGSPPRSTKSRRLSADE
eukprot:1817850-Prymnesium_polylepis.2